jgi:hypothetical protein
VIIVAVVAGGGYYAYHYETTGKLKMSAADSPTTTSGVTGVYITFSAVSLHSDKASSNSTGWTNYSLHDKTVNILNLTTSNAAFLSNLSVHTSSYNMMKLYIKNVTVHIDAALAGTLSTTTSINMSLAHAFALVVFVHPVTVSAHSTVSMVTGFNLSNNMHLSTNHKFNMSATVNIVS